MNDYPEYLEPLDVTDKKRRRRRLLWAAGVVVVLLMVGQTFLSDWVDLLWFDSLGFGEVFWKTFALKSIVFCVFTAATFALLFGAFALIRRCHAGDLPKDHAIVIGGQKVTLSVAPVLRWLSLGVAVVVALFAGFAMLAEWPTLAMFWYAPPAPAGGVTDPIFGKPLNFYLFDLPAWQLVDGWLLTLALATCGVAVAFLVITSGARTVENRKFSVGQSPFRGLSATGALLLAVIAMSVYVDRYQQLLEHHTLFDGINYTDAHVTIHGLLILAIALLLGAIALAVNAVRESRGVWIAGAVAPAAVVFVGMNLAAWYTASFIVKPNELVDETPYIAHNIELTRQAYGLDKFSQSEFPAETNVDAADPANNQPTLNNIRLWDWHALQDTLRQVQEIRTYYDFPDIDIDRYVLDGNLREVMLAERELNVDKLPVSSRNWINEKLIYTHGYGVTMNGVNGFTSEGLPILLLSNMPVQSTVPGLKVTRPELYFGELTGHRCVREDAAAGVRLPAGAEQYADVVPRDGWDSGWVGSSSAAAAGGGSRRFGYAAVFGRCQFGEPAADAAEYPRAGAAAGAVSCLRPGPVCGSRGRRAAFVDDGRVHGFEQLSVTRRTTRWLATR